ncbi:MAG TPA: alpha/beta fold hydrolase [Polyangiaceae bacterium]|nr:alpha/beta fold hydrolase [Polyangiaceae bacterium]
MTEAVIRHYRHDCGQATLHVAEAGEGEPVLLLHGFPELWFAWRRMLVGLAASGFRAIAPDLRGYGSSDKPRGIEPYRVSAVLGDLRTLIRERCGGSASLVAHDWGGTLAYCLASESPELVTRLTILNAAQPERLGAMLLSSTQLFRSWYIFAFQLPVLPEWFLQQRAVMDAILRGSAARPDTFSDDDILRYHAALLVPHAAESAVNYYRASFRWPVSAVRPLEAPTLVIWGDRDAALDQRLLDGLEAFVPKVRIEHVPNAGHFVHHEQPELVERLVREHLRAG